LIELESVERANDWMRDNSIRLAQAKANRIYIERYLKSKHGELFLVAPEGSIASKEAWSYCHTDYIELLNGLKAAVEQETELQHKYTAAEVKIAIWRTLQANQRGLV
tara:strand:- start:352 stop:672 length:321 start_codon:yes stop_codon:yes gene_type:complete